MTLMKAKKPLALLLALLAALSLLGTTALAAGLPEETIAAQTELCGEDCGHTHEEVFSHTEHTEESLPEPEEIAVPVATPLLEQPEPEAGQPSDTSGVIPGSGIYWELNEYGWLMLSGNGSCPTFVSPDDQPWAAVREQITQVWFEDMDALCIPSLAYWFTGCTALTMAEIPYTTPVIGAAAFADCPSLRQIQLYYSGAFTIVPGAFSTGSLTPLLVLFIPEYDSVLGTLAAYDWTEDRRAAYFEDVYGITLLATGYCSNCKRTCSYTVEYEQWTNSEHCVRHWCSNCGYDQAGGVNGEAHSFRSGVCSKCGYSNGSGGGGGGGGNVCYHSSTRTSWSGCDWYEYCRSCGALVDYGTSHGTYVYGAWEYYSSSQHRRVFGCEVVFGADFDGIVLRRDDLQRPHQQHDQAMEQHARFLLDNFRPPEHQPGMAQQVERTIRALLPHGRHSLAQVAQAMGCTVRALQRQLEERGTSYQQCLDNVRTHAAKRGLSNARLSINEVAVQAGFAENSSFTRWFQSRHQLSPSQWRQQQGQG